MVLGLLLWKHRQNIYFIQFCINTRKVILQVLQCGGKKVSCRAVMNFLHSSECVHSHVNVHTVPHVEQNIKRYNRGKKGELNRKAMKIETRRSFM